MTREEFIAQRFATKLKLALRDEKLDDIRHEHAAVLEEALRIPMEEHARLNDEDTREHETLTQTGALDFIPYKRYDFVKLGETYYEVRSVRIDLDRLNHFGSVRVSTITAPPKDWLSIKLECYQVRKSGRLAKFSMRLTPASVKKAEMAEDVCLRRAIKQRMRLRLEGGD